MVELRAYRVSSDPDDLLRHGGQVAPSVSGHSLATVGTVKPKRVDRRLRRGRLRVLTPAELAAVEEAKRDAAAWTR